MAIFSGSYAVVGTTTPYNAFFGDMFDQLTGMGWVQTADTGQADPHSAAATGSPTNYFILRSNDGLANIYIKISFYIHNSVPSRAAVDIVVGTGTNGTGTITGNNTGTISLLSNVTVTAGMYISADTSRMAIVYAPEVGSSGIHVTIERGKDATGANLATYFSVIWSRPTAAISQVITFSGTNGLKQDGVRAAHPSPNGASTGTWAVAGNVAYAFPVPVHPTGFSNPMLDAAIGNVNDFPTGGTTASLHQYGAQHTFLIHGISSGYITIGNTMLLTRYE